MSLIDDQETLQIFVADSQEHLNGIESDLLAIEAGGADMDLDLINKVFRAVHSIKGGAGFLGLETLKELAHSMENLLNMMRNRELIPTSATISTLLEAADVLKGMVNNPGTSNAVNIAAQLAGLKQVTTAALPDEAKDTLETRVSIRFPDGREAFSVAAFDLEQARKGGKEVYLLTFDLLRDIDAKHKTPLQVIHDLQQTGMLLDSQIDINAVGHLTPAGDLPLVPFYVLFATLLDADMLGSMLDLAAGQIQQIAPTSAVATPVPVMAAPAELPAAASPAYSVPLAAAPECDTVHPPHAPAPGVSQESTFLPPATPAGKPAVDPSGQLAEMGRAAAEGSLRVNVKVLDTLMTLAGELVLTRNQLVQAVASNNTQAVEATVQRVDLVTSELQEAIMSTRMQPIGTVFNKFQRIVRDMSRDLRKDVALVIEGEEVELDKTIIEAIGDPLMHLVRNSMDHGIEAPERRQQRGKPRKATVALRARHEAGQVIIEASDDGGGIHPDKIRDKALAMGLYDRAQLEAMSDKELINLIFLPGFSTAKQLTDISGRGVGMDVVHTNLSKIGGTIDVESVVEQGTTFRIKLPLTLAIIPCQLVAVQNERYAIPQVNLVELVRIPAAQVLDRLERLGAALVMRHRGELLPLIDLRNVLDLSKAETGERGGAGEAVNIVVVTAGSLTYGLIVDQLLDSEEIVVKPLGQHLHGCKIYAGATIQGDGRVALILDVTGVGTQLHLHRGNEARRDAARAKRSETQQQQDMQTLLIVKNAPDEQFAIPLSLVSRIEKVRRSALELTAGRLNMQYRGGNLVLLSIEEALSVSPRAEHDDLAVVVFQVGGREVGLLVSQIVEVTEVEVSFDHLTFRRPGVLGSAIILEKTTLLLDLFGIVEAAMPEYMAKPPVVASDGGAPTTILVVEDSNFFLQHIKGFVEEAGYRVLTAQDGLEALDQLTEHVEEIDLVLTDIEMPNLDGLELTKRIRNDARFTHLPIIALTSVAGEAAEKRGLAAGINDYLIKLDKEKVIERIAYRLTARCAA